MDLASLDSAAALVHHYLPPTPQFAWPLLAQRLGCEVWVKHENHHPVGAFKVRGGVYHLSQLAARGVTRVIGASRGNHGQSLAYAARLFSLQVTIVVPHNNCPTKNRAMRAWGATVLEHGADFQAALEHAQNLAAQDNAHFVPSFSFDLARGVASYALEFFRAAPPLDIVYVPIGLGSGICGTLAARDALGLKTEVVGVVAAEAAAYALSLQAGQLVSTATANTIADGLACRVPHPDAFAYLRGRVSRIVKVSENAIRAAIRHYFEDTQQLAEGASAAALAAAELERDILAGKRIGLILTGGNLDPALLAEILTDPLSPPT